MRVSYGRVVAIALLATWAVILGGSAAGQESAGLDSPVLPYQGQLADQSGTPVNPAEPITLVFRTYSQPTGGTANWEEAHETVQVVGGRFSVLLGARQPFPAEVLDDFKRTVYLGLTVDDGEPATADIEMRPRQAIVPVIAARRALRADRADWAGQAERATAADRATVALQLDQNSSLAREVADLEAGLLDLISYVGELRERIRDLEDAVAAR